MKYVGGLTERALKSPAAKRGFFEAILLEKWDEIFQGNARFMRPVNLWKGKLTIATNSPSAAHNIKMQGSYLIGRLNQFVGYGAVKEIKFQVKSFLPKEDIVKPEEVKVSKQAALSAKVECAHIEDEDVRICFEGLSGLIKMNPKKEVN